MTLYVQSKNPELQLAFVFQGKQKLENEMAQEGIEYRGRIAGRLNHTELNYGDVIVIDNYRVVDIVKFNDLENDYHVYESVDDFEENDEVDCECDMGSSAQEFFTHAQREFAKAWDETRQSASNFKERAARERRAFQENPRERSEAYRNRARKETKSVINQLGSALQDLSKRL